MICNIWNRADPQIKNVLCHCWSPVLVRSWNCTRSFWFYSGVLVWFFFCIKEQWEKKNCHSCEEMILALTLCRDCLYEQKIVNGHLPHWSLNAMLLAGLLPCPSASLFGCTLCRESCWLPMCRATGVCFYLSWAQGVRKRQSFSCSFP